MRSDFVPMPERLNLLPEPAFQELRPVLVERLERVGSNLRAEQFSAMLDPLMRLVLERGFAEAGAHEGTVWLLDEAEQHLVPAFNSGPYASRLVGQFKQPLDSGLVCMVFASEQPFLENGMQTNTRQSRLLDAALEVQTSAMLAVPFYFLRRSRGVVSCVQLRRPGSSGPSPPGFRPEHLASLEFSATLLSRLIEFKLLSRTVGWASE